MKGLVEDYLRSSGEEASDKDNLSYMAIPLAIKYYSVLAKNDPGSIGNADFQFLFGLVRIFSTNDSRHGYDMRLDLLEKSSLRERDALQKILEDGRSRESTMGMFTQKLEYKLWPEYISDDSARNFIILCTRVFELLQSDERERALEVLDEGLREPNPKDIDPKGIDPKGIDHKGIGVGMTSEILHCLDPDVFPILNGSQGNGQIVYEALGVKLPGRERLVNYVRNTRMLQGYRDEFWPGKSFRTLDNAQNCAEVAECLSRPKKSGKLDRQYWIFRTMRARGEEGISSLGEGDARMYALGLSSGDDGSDREYAFFDISDDQSERPQEFNVEEILASIAVGDKVIAYDNASGDKAGVSGVCEVTDFSLDDQSITLKKRKGLVGGGSLYVLSRNPLLSKLETTNHLVDGFSVRMCKLSEEQFNAIIESCGGAEEMDEEKSLVDKVCEEVKESYNLILHGAPGTGKTYLARQVAAKIIGCEPGTLTNPGNEEYQRCHKQFGFVQFHPSYDYTDFVEGLRPSKGDEGIGFELKDGTFASFLKEAANDPDKKFVFVIDEINRGDISKILGELFFSIDPDYRGQDGGVLTQYANMHDDPDERLYVPENVYVIGTMNDIDRSVDTFDFAMRRRFRFVEITPEDTAGEILDEDSKLIGRLKRLNKVIKENPDLGPTYEIGASYLLGRGDDGTRSHAGVDELDAIWKHQLRPLVCEYLRGTRSKDDLDKTLEKMYKALCGETSTEMPD